MWLICLSIILFSYFQPQLEAIKFFFSSPFQSQPSLFSHNFTIKIKTNVIKPIYFQLCALFFGAVMQIICLQPAFLQAV